MKGLIILVCLFSLCAQANMEEYATYIDEARVLVESRDYLKEVREDLSTGGKLDRRKLAQYETKLETIGKYGCDCGSEKNLIKAQAYALIGAINGVISKETKSISHGKKSYRMLALARQIDSRNVDAIRGQAEALKAIFSQGFFARNIVSLALGLNLKVEKRKLIRDLRTFRDHPILLGLADQLQRL